MKPNIIFFMVDQMGAKWLEAAMDGICDLPNLKRLKDMGVTFNHAYSNNPVCCPARATIATGLSSTAHGLISNGYRLNPEIPTFMRTLQSAGWATGAFGKILNDMRYKLLNRVMETDYPIPPRDLEVVGAH